MQEEQSKPHKKCEECDNFIPVFNDCFGGQRPDFCRKNEPVSIQKTYLADSQNAEQNYSHF